MSGVRLLYVLALANLLFLAGEILYNVLGLLAGAR
jgi:hypothetical protein